MKKENKYQGFNPSLKAEDLPNTVLTGLWQRTGEAHENLFQIWYNAVSNHSGESVAKDFAGKAWPQYLKGASMREIFFDDLKLAVGAVQLMPALLTVSKLDTKRIPDTLHCTWTWFRILRMFSDIKLKLFYSENKAPVNKKRPALLGYIRAKGIDTSRFLLLKVWQWSDARDKRLDSKQHINIDDTLSLEEMDNKALAQLWNIAAIAYMMVTYCWYGVVQDKFGTDVAQKMEKDVWNDLGAAEHDLRIGLDAVGATGKDVESLFRGFQFAPGEVGILNVNFELKSPNHGILHHHTCPAIDRFEDYDDDRLKHCCDLCVLAMPLSGKMLNPNIKCRPRKLPPRNKTDLACEWEYTLE